MFPATSRYHAVDTATFTAADGRETVYLRRRFAPPPGAGPLIAEHAVVQDDRLDNITARYLGDPEQFWRVCDANRAMQPQLLTDEIGRRLRIVFPQEGAI
jgi:hypothetical protein